MVVDGYIHLHSKYSYDGKFSLAEIKQILKKEKISFFIPTEHYEKDSANLLGGFLNECKTLSSDDLLVIPGLEIPYLGHHILVLGIQELVIGCADALEMIEKYKEQGAIAVWAHPSKGCKNISREKMDFIDGIEVWNTQYDGHRLPDIKAVKYFKQLVSTKRLQAYGGLDFHDDSLPLSPRIRCQIDGALGPAALIDSLKKGNYSILDRHSNEYLSDLSNLDGRRLAKVSYRSGWSGLTINLAKRINSLLHKLGIKIPSKIKKIARRVI